MKKDPKSHPTSRIVRKAGQKKRANYVSVPKCAGYIQLESTLEATTAFALALDPRVASFRPQPCTYDLLSGRSYAKKENLIDEFVGKRYRPKPYTPDFLVRMRDGRAAFVETKAESRVNEDLHRDFLPKFFRSVGHHWTLTTDETLTEVVAHNVRTLKAVIDRPPTEKTLKILAQVPKDTVLGLLVAALISFETIFNGFERFVHVTTTPVAEAKAELREINGEIKALSESALQDELDGTKIKEADAEQLENLEHCAHG
ncbi:Tn7 transposase TnsA N-terminal domain-containing protein [Ruegeria marisrubri]|uniref:Tn7 transposase TnsA N-terminal domain-containing protein n=1 Tax=Ruegeria marisrubri TaxID=1685379 RepID=UPI001CD5AF50|nr:Tn7 transposase TnsA N-terminal domain-containing protein [Ruegeria marisrubri]MCA0907736.1 Tn7 transposase TnsA N-terminal domain-containing protein [Ruegeria marisrubri]